MTEYILYLYVLILSNRGVPVTGTLAWSHVDDVAAVADVNEDEWLVCQSPRHRNSVCETSETNKSKQ